jgi:hypothetical protein
MMWDSFAVPIKGICLTLLAAYVATSISHFVPFEACNLIDTVLRFGSFASLGQWALIAVIGMEIVVYMALKVGRVMKPLVCTNENAACEPFRAIVAIGGTIVGTAS